jgi:hypothetical protein
MDWDTLKGMNYGLPWTLELIERYKTNGNEWRMEWT